MGKQETLLVKCGLQALQFLVGIPRRSTNPRQQFKILIQMSLEDGVFYKSFLPDVEELY